MMIKGWKPLSGKCNLSASVIRSILFERKIIMNEVVIASVARTPMAKYRGDFAAFSVPKLGAIPIKAAVEKIGLDPAMLDEVIMGNIFGSDWGNPARNCVLEAGFPQSVPAITVDRQCASSLNAVALASAMIMSGAADIIMTGGVESYSQQPYYLQRPAMPYPAQMEFLPYKSSLPDGLDSISMIQTAENLAVKYALTREECDAFAVQSHQKAAKAWETGYFDDQVVPVEVPQRKGAPLSVTKDAGVRSDCSIEGLAKLHPLMKGGVVTAGNASPMNDGASAVLVMNAQKAKELQLEPLAIVKEFCSAGCDPDIMGIGPVYSTRRLMAQYGYKIDDFDLVELNEAFAAQSLPCIRELGIRPERVNVEGGAIAIGHPNGASGGMLVGRMVYALRRRSLHRGLISFCCGGGQGFSLVLENPQA